jgi:hypothetical protein
MLNTGVLLRKPFESDYATYRRRLLANPGFTRAQLRARARVIDPDASLDEVWRTLESQQPLRAVKAITGSVGRTGRQKNCVCCAGIGYHSPVYNLDWLTRCPLHREPLSTSCPACGAHWPSLAELSKRACTVCGGRIPAALLAERGAFTPALDFSGLAFLYRCIEAPLYTRLTLHSDRPIATYQRDQIEVNDAFFPALISYDRPHIESELRQLGVDIPPACARRGRLIAAPPPSEEEPPDSWGTPVADWEIAVRFQVLAKIQRAIADVANPPHCAGILPEDQRATDTPYCGYCVALSLWFALIAHRPSLVSPNATPQFGRELFPSYFVRRYPYAPWPWSYARSGDHRYRLQKSLQRYLYALDLWTLFIHLASFLDASYEVGRRRSVMLLSDFLSGLRYPAALGSEVPHPIGFRVEHDDVILILTSAELGLQKARLPRLNFATATCPNNQTLSLDRYGNLNALQCERLASRLLYADQRPR